jgi:5-(carboxyamino)imidazole ribonucleotide mutase
MPAGIPVATVALGSAGPANAALLAVQILAITDESLRQKLHEFKTELSRKVEAGNSRIQEALANL